MHTPRLTIDEIRLRFGSATERREELYGQFVEWCTLLLETGVVRRLWLYGSFPSSKPGPNDVDAVVLVQQGFVPSHLSARQRSPFDPDLAEALWSVHAYVITEDLAGVYLDGLLGVLRQSRDGEDTLVEVIL